MKADIHPKYVECTVRCSCGNTFTTRSVVPEINTQICSQCHPFFTGKQKFVDSAGRVEKFMRRYGKTAGEPTVAETPAAAAPSAEAPPAASAEPAETSDVAPPAVEPQPPAEEAADAPAEDAPEA